jgi:hypothetical protein
MYLESTCTSGLQGTKVTAYGTWSFEERDIGLGAWGFDWAATLPRHTRNGQLWPSRAIIGLPYRAWHGWKTASLGLGTAGFRFAVRSRGSSSMNTA